MRKILSIALALCMLCSLSTVAFAESNGYSTTVTYNGTGESEWELNVPITMPAGDSGNVTLEGTWDASTVFNVDADDTVTMGNDINNDTETLDITFNAIEQVGNNYDRISVVEPISVAEMPDVLFGEWKGVFNYYLTVDKAEVVKELEQDAEGNYLVSTAVDLFTLSELVNSGENDFAGETVLLVNDIDMKNVAFTPIGIYDEDGKWWRGNMFRGTFDGQENTIYNLNVTAANPDTTKGASAGLFAYVNGGTIKDLTVDGATVNSTHFAGVIVGNMQEYKTSSADIRETIVDNCHVLNATVTSIYHDEENSGDKAGVIVGNYNSGGYVKNCTATDSTISASRDAGQIVGCGIDGNVTNCTVTNVIVSWNGVGTGENINNDVVGRIR